MYPHKTQGQRVHLKLSHPVIDFVFLLRASAIRASLIALRLPTGFLLAARQNPNKFVLCSRSQRRLASVANGVKQSRELKIKKKPYFSSYNLSR